VRFGVQRILLKAILNAAMDDGLIRRMIYFVSAWP
jgi:hypothetical protein